MASLTDLTEEHAAEFIRRRRWQVLVHSCIYYCFNENIISDHQWAQWAQELTAAQEQFPEIAAKEVWAPDFQNFDPSTGFNLPIKDPGVVGRARYLLRLRDKRRANDAHDQI